MHSETQFRSVWENSFDAMRLTDENGIIIKVNNAFCKLVEKTRDELEGNPYNVIYVTHLMQNIMFNCHDLQVV
ncbi:MAG: PAS domain S-box protein, partial [Ignavibacteriaceae bacterium]